MPAMLHSRSVFRATLVMLALLPLRLAAQAPAAPTAPARPDTPAWSGTGQLALSRHTASANSFSVSLGHLLNYARTGRSFTLATTYNSNSFEYDAPQAGGAAVKRVMRTSSAVIASHYRLTVARRNYWVVLGQWEHDRGQSIARRVHGAAGLGRTLVHTRRAQLQAEAVGGYLHERDTDRKVVQYPVVGSALNLTLPLSATGAFTSFNSAFGNTGGRDDWIFRTQNSLSAQINRILGIAISFDAAHDTKPSLAFFDPTGEGEIGLSPSKRVTDLSASLTIGW